MSCLDLLCVFFFSESDTDAISFMPRLLFMTYNGMVMLAVAVGAFVGYLTFADDTTATKSIACH